LVVGFHAMDKKKRLGYIKSQKIIYKNILNINPILIRILAPQAEYGIIVCEY